MTMIKPLEETSVYMNCRQFGKLKNKDVQDFVESKGFSVVTVNKKFNKFFQFCLTFDGCIIQNANDSSR